MTNTLFLCVQLTHTHTKRKKKKNAIYQLLLMPSYRTPSAPFCLTTHLDLATNPRVTISPTLGTIGLGDTSLSENG